MMCDERAKAKGEQKGKRETETTASENDQVACGLGQGASDRLWQ
jgi:hypothetical protein